MAKIMPEFYGFVKRNLGREYQYFLVCFTEFFDSRLSFAGLLSSFKLFKIDQIDGSEGTSVFGAGTGIMFIDALFKIVGEARVQATIATSEDIHKPSGHNVRILS